MSFRFNTWLAMLIVAGTQSAVLGAMVVDRALLIQQGREIILDVQPVDPRSLFRGDYVILNYGSISRPGASLLKEVPKEKRTLFVTLRRAAEGWQPVATSEHYPDKVEADDVVMKGQLPRRYSRQVQYGIESYFVPEGEGKRLEKLIGKGQLKVIVAVDETGRAAIKGLVVEGQRVYDEPML